MTVKEPRSAWKTIVEPNVHIDNKDKLESLESHQQLDGSPISGATAVKSVEQDHAIDL